MACHDCLLHLHRNGDVLLSASYRVHDNNCGVFFSTSADVRDTDSGGAYASGEGMGEIQGTAEVSVEGQPHQTSNHKRMAKASS